MRLFLSPFLLVGQLVGSSATSDCCEFVDVCAEQQAQLKATINELLTDFSELKEKYDALVASTTAQRHERAQWQRETNETLQLLAGRRRLTSAVSTQRRGLSSDTCADPSGPTLLVEGVCSCTEGLLVEGRNVTKELDELTVFNAGVPAVAECNCSTLDTLVMVGSIKGVANMQGPIGVSLSPDGNYAYVAAANSDGIAVVNVTDPSSPSMVGSIAGDDTSMDAAFSIAVPSSCLLYTSPSPRDRG